MATDGASLVELRERLQDLGDQVPGRAEAFHRERAALLNEIEDALSWRGVLVRGRTAARLGPRTDSLVARGQALQGLFGQISRIEERLATAARTLARVEDQALRAPDCIPQAAERIATELGRIGRQVATDDELVADRRRCDQLKASADCLTDALTLWLAAEDALTKIRGSTRTAALQAALPELRERLCREGLTPQWRTELKALVDPLDLLARREQPRELRETEKIVRDLPRWAKVLGEECDACQALATRFMARRKDWPGEDDRTFAELFDQARRLEQTLLDKAAAVRGQGLGDLEARLSLFAELIAPDPRLEEQLRDLASETPEDPRDHEDWIEQIKGLGAAFQARVKRSETELVAKIELYLGECAQRLEAVGALRRLDEQDAHLARLRDRFDALTRAGQGNDALQLLADVERARTLRADLDALEADIRQVNETLAGERAAIHRRAQWLAERARELNIALPEETAGLASPIPPSAPQTGAQQERQALERSSRLLAEAETQFSRLCRAELDFGNQRIGQVLAVLDPRHIREGGLDISTIPLAAADDPTGIAESLSRVRARLAAVSGLLATEEQALTALAAQRRDALAAIPADRLGHNDRSDRETTLRDLERWSPDRLADPVERIAALRDLIDSAEHVLKRFETAARRMQERRESLRERLRRFNGLFLQGYCPELYVRVEALVHPPSQTRWPRDAEEWQLREAERLLGLLERQGQRLAAREVAEHMEVLERHALRAADGEVRTLVDEVRALPLEQPPPARLRRRLAELAEAQWIRA